MKDAFEFTSYEDGAAFAKFVASRGAESVNLRRVDSVWNVTYDFNREVKFSHWPHFGFEWRDVRCRYGKKLHEQERLHIISEYLTFKSVEQIAESCARRDESIDALLRKEGLLPLLDLSYDRIFERFGDTVLDNIEMNHVGLAGELQEIDALISPFNACWTNQTFSVAYGEIKGFAWNILARYCYWTGDMTGSAMLYEYALGDFHSAFWISVRSRSSASVIELFGKLRSPGDREGVAFSAVYQLAKKKLLDEIPRLFECFSVGDRRARSDYGSRVPRFSASSQLSRLWQVCLSHEERALSDISVLQSCVAGDLSALEIAAKSGSQLAATVAADLHRSRMWSDGQYPLDAADEMNALAGDYIPSIEAISKFVRSSLP
ncbi:MAG: hypothetical protein EOP81_11350 [Variovorax sp.]|nr:MAG: hypothetical protein EOP81_11350 [Variovorax sp.]